MLYLTRKVGDSVIIDDNIEVTVVEVRGKTVKLGFTFPENIQVLRRELYDRIQDENRSATASVDFARIFNNRAAENAPATSTDTPPAQNPAPDTADKAADTGPDGDETPNR
ncbi:carbon storage regulator CsrA [Thalassospira mesophila]|uniref:carbon storage regulator CsrA n=1 Tax=Thalassospira mesophila TaxID=1293891 RepID=UPI000A20004E|nr:carbon storage regulator CsrA [Thalassospira mesophila]